MRHKKAHSQLADAELIEAGLALIKERIAQKDISTSMGDLIRLLEMRSAITERDPAQEVKIGWIPSEDRPLEPSRPEEEIAA